MLVYFVKAKLSGTLKLPRRTNKNLRFQGIKLGLNIFNVNFS
jgi:hypothetical protein